MKHKYIIWLIAVLVSLTAQPQSLKDLTLGRPDNTNLHQQAREFILAGKINEAIATYNALVIQQQNARNQGTQVNPEVMAEYAYALALGGAQAEALKNIDIALALSQSNTNTYFYIPQILRTIGLPALAAAYKYPFGAPKWIGTDAERLTAKYSLPCLLSCGANPTKFIADLLAQNRYIEAVAYASLNASQNPESQVACMLLSTAMEKCGLYQSSLTELRRVGQIEGASLPKGYMEQLAYLENKARKKGNNPTFAQPLSSMLYGGIGYGNSGTSVNGR